MRIQSDSNVIEEMKAVFAAIEVGSIGLEPLKVSTKSGRKYEVCYVTRISEDLWASTNGRRVRGYFFCENCSENPGGDWFQITLKNGTSSEPVVRLFEIIHRFKQHPATLDNLATDEKCVNVFGNVIGSGVPESGAMVACFDIVAMKERAKAYVTQNLFKSPFGDFKYVSPEDLRDLLAYIQDILSNVEFQSNPKKYLDNWAQNRNNKDWTRMMHDDVARYFFDHHFECSYSLRA